MSTDILNSPGSEQEVVIFFQTTWRQIPDESGVMQLCSYWQ
jgi:hypothetical protein